MEKIRQSDPGVRAIVSSGYSDDPVMSRYLDYGFLAVLPKPYNPLELRELVEQLLGDEPDRSAMNFSGTLDETSGMTMTRLIERIVHTDTPGELRLHDEASGRRAVVAIRRGMVAEVSFGELSGDPALTAISQAAPWTFEFVPDEAGAAVVHPGIAPRRAKARAVVRTAPVAAAPSPPTTAIESAPPPPAEDTVTPAWLAEAHAHTLRFAAGADSFTGEVDADDHDYFRSDYQFLRSTAASIGRSLGLEAPVVFAIAEEERATGYSTRPDGFLGIMGGAGTGVAHVIDFPS